MSDLVGNPEDRFSHNEARMVVANLTCSFEIGTLFKPLSDTALRVGGECLLYVVHLDPPRRVLTLPEQAVDEHLKWRKPNYQNHP